MKKKLSLKRILILSLAFVMSVSVLVFGGCSLFNNEAETEPKADGNLVVSEITKSPLIAFSAPVLASDGSTTITATVSPSTGVDSRLNWTMSWGVEHSGNPSDYVTLSVSEDTLTATLYATSAFGSPIVVTATSVANPVCSASCQLDYLKRLEGTFSFQYNSNTETFSSGPFFFGKNDSIDLRGITTSSVANALGVGSLTPTIDNITCTYTFSDAFWQGIQNYLMPNISTNGQSINIGEAVISVSSLFGVDVNDPVSLNSLYFAIDEGTTNLEGAALFVDVIISYGSNYGANLTAGSRLTVIFDNSDMLSVYAVNLNQSNIIF